MAVLDEPLDHDDFIFELKYDGFRALADVDSSRCRLISRNHHEFTTFPEFCAAIGQALPGQLVCWTARSFTWERISARGFTI